MEWSKPEFRIVPKAEMDTWIIERNTDIYDVELEQNPTASGGGIKPSRRRHGISAKAELE